MVHFIILEIYKNNRINIFFKNNDKSIVLFLRKISLYLKNKNIDLEY